MARRRLRCLACGRSKDRFPPEYVRVIHSGQWCPPECLCLPGGSGSAILLECLERADPLDIVYLDQTPEYPDVVCEALVLLSDVYADLSRVTCSL